MSAPRLPKSELYWTKRGKKGKKVMLYTHDDLDGIASAVVVKKYLLSKGYDILGYGIINYNDGWKYTILNDDTINIAVDFAQMPELDREHLIDYYVDHHGLYDKNEKEHFKAKPVIKTKTDSAYEGICVQLGYAQDSLLLDAIDMIDSAKYTEYGVDWRDIITFDLHYHKELIKKSGIRVAKLTFAGAFNQFIKRGDHRTLIEVIHNLDDISIYKTFLYFKKLYGGNNFFKGTENPKDFLDDGKWRIATMYKRTVGYRAKKTIYNSQELFTWENFNKEKVIKTDGYQIIGNMIYVPSGTWANALRMRSIMMHEIDKGNIPNMDYSFIMLQYGNTLQVCSVNKMDKIKKLPKYKNGSDITNLGEYMGVVLSGFKKQFNYDYADTRVGSDDITISGGHDGIGTISNIYGKVIYNPKYPITRRYEELRYIDLMKNKIIKDLCGIEWTDIGQKWSEKYDNHSDTPSLDYKVMLVDKIRKINNRGEVWIENSVNLGMELNPDNLLDGVFSNHSHKLYLEH